jgi:hypothetical protein
VSETAAQRITVYRVVDAAELAVLRAAGNHGSNPSRSGKYFALTLQGARAFARAGINAGSIISTTTLPTFVVDDPGRHGAGPSVFFAELQLPAVLGTMTSPSIVFEES